ncbi:hypothetical protein Tco_1494694 [Tanacetum coccineum]
MKTSSHRFKGSLRFGFRLALSRLQQTGAYGFKGLLIFLRFIKAIHGEKGYLDVTIPPSRKSIWIDIIRDVSSLENKDIDLMAFV